MISGSQSLLRGVSAASALSARAQTPPSSSPSLSKQTFSSSSSPLVKQQQSTLISPSFSSPSSSPPPSLNSLRSLSSQPPLFKEGEGVHKVAAAGFNDSDAMERYSRARPSYMEDAVDCLLKKVLERVMEGGERKTIKILDLACGTGKLTVPVFKHLSSSPSFNQFNFEIYAVEPAEAMRVELDKNMASLTSSNVKAIAAVDGSSHDIPYEDGFFDGILIGQAFHWFCNEKSMVEMNRVVNNKGGVGMIWNLESGDFEWLLELRKMYQEYDAGLPQYHKMEWKKFLEEREPVGLECPPLLSEDFTQDKIMSANLLWDRVLSKSYVAVLSEEEKARLKKRIDDHLAKHFPQLDRDEECLSVPLNTKVVWMKKVGE